MRRNKRGIVFLSIGVILICGAFTWFGHNITEDRNAGKQSTEILLQMEEQSSEGEHVVWVEDEVFCGVIKIPKLGVELPVYDEWDYEKLRNAPCRYTGDVATNDMVIAAHNYRSHFGQLKQLEHGDEIIFTDAYGKEHHYSVNERIVLDGSDVNDMKTGEWALTIFTCTKSGKQRITVRCDKK